MSLQTNSTLSLIQSCNNGLDILSTNWGPSLTGIAAIIGLGITIFHNTQERKKESARRTTELILNHNKDVVRIHEDLVNETDQNKIVQKAMNFLDSVDVLAYLYRDKAISDQVSEYFINEFKVAEYVINWLEQNRPIENTPKYYHNRWHEVLTWLKNNQDNFGNIAVSKYDLPIIMRPNSM